MVPSLRLLLTLLLLPLLALVGHGQSTWTGSVSTDWNDPGNWSSGAVPTSTVDVLVPAGGNQPDLTSGTAQVKDLSVLESAVVSVSGTGTLEVHGDLTLVDLGGVSGQLDLGPIGADLRLFGMLIQDDGAAITSAGGRVLLEGGASLAGSAILLPAATLATGTTTLLAEAGVVDLIVTAGASAGAFPWVFSDPVTSYVGSATPLHHARLDAGVLWGKVGSFDHLHLNGGELYVTPSTTLTVTGTLEAVAGSVDFFNLNSRLVCQGSVIAGPGVTWDEGFVEMDGTTTISGPGGGTGYLSYVHFKSGLCTLTAPLRVSDWVGANGGGAFAGDWIETDGAVTVSQGLLSQVRVVAGTTKLQTSTIDKLELVGGTLQVVGSSNNAIVTQADLQGGAIVYDNPLTSRLEIQGDLIAGTGVAHGDGYLSMDGTTTITGPGGTTAFVGGIDLAGGTCDLLTDVQVDTGLKTSGGTSTGAWFECVGTDVALQELGSTSTAVHRMRMAAGIATVEGPMQVDDLELTGGVLRVPPGEAMTVNTAAALLAGQLEFEDSGSSTAELEVLGDVHHVATTGVAVMSTQGKLVCHGVWTGDAPIDLGHSFVEFADGSSIGGVDPRFARLRLASAATVTLLNKVVVSGRFENAGGTSQGLWFELVDDGVVLATTTGTIHDLRILAGRTVVENATVDLLSFQGGELEVGAGTSLTVTSFLDLIDGTLTLDPTDSGATALIEVTGDVNWKQVVPSATTGSGGLLRCEGIWYGNGHCDLGDGFAELGGGATVIGGSLTSFRRLRVKDGSVSLNATTLLTEELVVDADSSTVGLYPFEARPGATGTLTVSGGGQVKELHVVEGTVDQQGGGADLLRVLGGTLRVTDDATAGDLSLEGGALAVIEGATLDCSGDLTLTAGTLEFEAGDGTAARIDVAGTVDSAGTLPGASLLATGVLACQGAWLGNAPLDLGDVWVEVGGPVGSPTSLSGLALSFGNLRVTGEADLVDLVTVTRRLEGFESATSGEWFRMNGAATELATTAGSLHRVRQASGVLTTEDAEVGEFELAGGELLVGDTATLTVTAWLELKAGTLAFDQAGGLSSARIETQGVLHQVATTPGSVTHADAGITARGECRLDGALDLGTAWLDLMPGARVTGTTSSVARLRVPLQSTVLADAAVEVPTTVTADLELEGGATLHLSTGELILTCPPVSLDGRIEVDGGAALVIGPTSGVTLSALGSLSLLGAFGQPAELRGLGGGWDLTINGSLEGRWFVVRDMDHLGLGPGASIGPKGLMAGTFERGLGTGPGPLLDLAVPGTFDLIGLDFVGGAGDTNVRRVGGAGAAEVTLHAYGGSIGGPAFEDDPLQGAGDPDGLLLWLNTIEPDLVPLELEGDDEAVVGWNLRVDYTAINQGGGDSVAPWIDRLWLTQNQVIGDEDDVGLAKFTQSVNLPSGQLMADGADIVVPTVDEGTWYLALRMDNGSVVDEGRGEGETNNLIFSEPLSIFATPRPNLAVAALDGPSTATDGETISVTWTVDNDGLGATDEGLGTGGTWQDRVYLSDDAAFGGDTLLGTFTITAGELPGGIAPDGSYTETRTMDLPVGISGDHWLIVRSDAIDEVGPEVDEDDNVLVAPALLSVTQTDLPDLVGTFDPITSPLGELFAGVEAELSWTLTNEDPDGDGLGGADGLLRQRFWYSLDPILDGSDTLILEQTVGVNLTPLATQAGTATIELPATAGTWWVFGELDVDDDVAELDEANNVWEQQLAIVPAGHEGSVATTFVEGLASAAAGSLTIPLTGQSTMVGSIQLVPNADLTVRVRRGDTRRVFEVTTDAVAAFTLDFEPLVGEAGTFEVFCDHPALDEDPLSPQATFVLHDLAVTPATLAESLVTGEVRLVSLGLENPGDVALSGLSLTAVGLPAHLAIQSVSLPASLPPGGADIATFELVAVTDAPDPAVAAGLTLDLGFDLGGVPTVARSLPLDVWVTPDQPDPIVVGLAPVVEVAGDGTTRVVLELLNQGGAPLTGAAFDLETAFERGLSCPSQEPFLPAVPTDLGHVGPGETRLLAFDVLAGACGDLFAGVTLSAYTVTLTADQGTWTFPFDLDLVASPTTTLTVHVEDAETWWSAAGADLAGGGFQVFGAAVVATDAAGTVVGGTTGFQGKVVLSGLTPGLHDLVIEPPPTAGAPAHLGWRGLVRVLAGQDTELTAYLPAAPAGLEVTATEAEDGTLDLAVAATPVAAASAGHLLVTSGQLLDLDLAVGAQAQFQVDLAHAGGAPCRGIELFAPDLDDYDFEPEHWLVGDLEQGQTASLVLTVTRTGAGDPCDLATAGSAASHGLRYHVPAGEAIWHWTPLLLQAPELQGPCAPRVVGGPAPDDLPEPLAQPPVLAGPASAAYLGGRHLGTWPRPVAALPADLLLPLDDSGIELDLALVAHEVRTGQALELTLGLDNPTDDLLVGVDVQLELRDAAGVLATSWFTIAEPTTVGIGALDGSASLAPGTQATGTWSLTPDHGLAAGVYSLVATVDAVLEGDAVQRSLPAVDLRVVPAPALDVELFLPSIAHGDWSATPSLFEPAEPFPVGLAMTNVGGGATVGLGLDSAGPLFAPDPAGAATGAAVIELELDGVPTAAGFGLEASLLGDLAPAGGRSLLWTASPYARADITGMGLALVHGDGREGPFLEPPVSLTAHELVHAAHVFDVTAGPLDDDLVDWLVDDPAVVAPTDPITGLPMEAFPDVVSMSAGPDLSLLPVLSPTLGPPPTHGNLVSTVEHTAAVGGWYVLRFDAPGGAYFDLAQVVRTAKAVHLPGLTVGGPADVSRVWVTERPLDVTGDGVPDVTRRIVHVVDHVSTPGVVRYDLVHQPSTAEALSADTELLAAATGGTQTLTLDAGPAHGGSDFIMLGSVSGTWPGFVLDGITIPLNIDPYFMQTLTNPSTATMIGGLGLLDPQGKGTVQVVVPTGFPAGIGLTAHHAYVVFPPGLFPITLASNPVPLFVLP